MFEQVTEMARGLVHAAAYCLPQEAMNALDTAKLWAYIIAGAALVIALISGGISIMYSREHGGGTQVVGTLAKIIIGAAIVAAAAGIAGIFLNSIATGCTPIG